MHALEERLQEYLQVPYVVLTASGTSALLAAYWVLREQYSTLRVDPYTFPATYQPARMLGYRVEFHRMVLQPRALFDAGTLNTVTHLFGQPAPMPHPDSAVPMLEDAAQSFGGEYQGKKLGTIGMMGIYSFYPTKILHTCGHGGAVVTHDRELYRALKLFVECGRNQGVMTDTIALNLRMDEVKAEFLLQELADFDEHVEQQRALARELRTVIPGEQPFLSEQSGDRHVYSVFNLLIDQRDEFRAHMDAFGIDTMVYYDAPMLPAAERPKYLDITSRVVAIPCRWSLTSQEITRIKEALESWFADDRRVPSLGAQMYGT